MKLINKIRKFSSTISLKYKIWIYFIVFTIAVFVLLWIFQILFLEKFYESMKTRDAAECLDEISESYKKMEPSEFSSYIDDMAVEHDICIEILDRYRRSIYSCDAIGDCLIHGRENRTQV